MEELQIIIQALEISTQKGVFTMADVVKLNECIEKVKLIVGEKIKSYDNHINATANISDYTPA